MISNEINLFANIIDSKLKLIDDHDTNNAKRQKLVNVVSKLNDRIKKAKDEIEFYENNDSCPTCNQDINDTLKTAQIEKQTSKIDEVEKAVEQARDQITIIQERIETITAIQTEISELQNNITDLNNEVKVNNKIIAKLNLEIDAASNNDVDIDNEKAKLKNIAKEVITLSEDKSLLNDEKYYLDVASILLKDTGIKTKIIKQYLPVMNKIINKYLQSMDFFVSFELDESFSEKIKSRHRDEFSYASFSEGEKQRIDLALMLAWRTIARMKNSTNTNLLILDEVFDSSLDASGADLLYLILDTLDANTNVFVISHRDSMFDKFRSVIRFEKKNNFSQIARQ